MAARNVSETRRDIQFPSLAHIACPGVYFLRYGGEIVYVGRAVDMRRRVGEHISEGLKVFDAATFLPCSVARLVRLERRYINRFLPKYNQCGASRLSRLAMRPESKPLPQVTQSYFTLGQAADFVGMSAEELLAADVRPKRIRGSKARRYRYDDLRALAM